MKRIDMTYGRIGYDGIHRSQSEIETWFVDKVKAGIVKRLGNLRLKDRNEKKVRTFLLRHIDKMLLGKPSELERYRLLYDWYKVKLPVPKAGAGKRGKRKRRPKTFHDKLLHAFGYKAARSGTLTELAQRLNVKCCPYCNLHYTLCIEDFDKHNQQVLMARFEFDHFIDKASYPFLSMSLYNLIPSCPVCNHGKSQDVLPLTFHPYHADIGKTFRFRVVNPIHLFAGKNNLDTIQLQLEKTSAADPQSYDKVFHVKKQYERHRDEVEDLFARAYQYYYYNVPDNFGFIGSPDLSKRLQLGFYPDERDINLRPMTKFKQDLWQQARLEVTKVSFP